MSAAVPAASMRWPAKKEPIVAKIAVAKPSGAMARSTTSDLAAMPGNAAIEPNARARATEATELLSHRPLNAAEKKAGRVECSAMVAAFGKASACMAPPAARQRELNASRRRDAKRTAALTSGWRGPP